MFCSRCGSQLNEGSVFCSKCGVRIAPVVDQPGVDASLKSRLATSLLAIFLGRFGAHRFYAGKIGTAIIMLLMGVISLVLVYGAVFAVLASNWTFPLAGILPMWGLGGVVSLAVSIWSMVDFVIAVTGNFRDGQGRVIRKW